MLVIANYVIAFPSVKSRGVQWWQGSTWPNDCRDAIIPARNLGQLCWYFNNTILHQEILVISLPLPTGHHIISFHPSLQNCAKHNGLMAIVETTGWYDCRHRRHLPSVRPVRKPVVLQIQHKPKSFKNQYRKRRSKVDLFCTEQITHLLTDLSKL